MLFESFAPHYGAFYQTSFVVGICIARSRSLLFFVNQICIKTAKLRKNCVTETKKRQMQKIIPLSLLLHGNISDEDPCFDNENS